MREMPTAAKLVAALCFGVVGWLTAEAFVPQIPDAMPATWIKEASAVIGVFVGWFVLGRAMGVGYARVFGRAITMTAILYFWLLFAFTFREMILRSLDKRYDGPMEAVTSMIDIALFFGTLSLHIPTLVTLFVGGLVSGYLVEFAKRNWR